MLGLVRRGKIPAARRNAAPAPGADADGLLPGDLPAQETFAWERHTATFATTSFWTMAARLPALTRQAFALAWATSPAITIATVILNLLSGLATALGLLAIGGVAQSLLAAGPTPDRLRQAVPSLVLVAVATAVRSGLGTAAGYMQAQLKPRALREVERRFYALSTRVDLAAFDDAGFSDEMDTVRSRGTDSTVSLVDEAIDLVTGLVGVIAVAVTIAIVHPLLLPALILAALPTGWASVKAARDQYVSQRQRNARRRRMWNLEWLMATRQTAAEIRSHGMAGYLLAMYDRLSGAELRADLDVARRQTNARALGGLLAGIAGTGVYAVLGTLLWLGWIPLAAGATGYVALQTGRSSLQTLVLSVNFLFEHGLYSRDLTAFMARASARIADRHPDEPTTGQPDPALAYRPRTVELEKVTFTYPDGTRPALDNISLTLRAGEVVAFVGENGSGKSTLAKILSGLYRPDSGRVLWNGTDTADLPADALRDETAVISQDSWKWPFTAGLNIHIGRHETVLDPADVEQAARAGGAHDLITDLTHGYDTILDRQFVNGADLSGGQWQRITASRTLYRGGGLLIADEPSSALDALAEHHLYNQLTERDPDRITCLISHRLATVRAADRIIVLVAGTITETGTHDELMTFGGTYAKLFTLQSAGYQAAEQN